MIASAVCNGNSSIDGGPDAGKKFQPGESGGVFAWLYKIKVKDSSWGWGRDKNVVELIGFGSFS